MYYIYVLQWWRPYVSIHSATNLITCASLRLKQMWRLTKAKTEMRREHRTRRWNWSGCTKLALRASWTLYNIYICNIYIYIYIYTYIQILYNERGYYITIQIKNKSRSLSGNPLIIKSINTDLFTYLFILINDKSCKIRYITLHWTTTW